MTEPLIPDIVVNICRHCLLGATELPRQWKERNSLVSVRELPCAGKIDAEYLMRTFEGPTAGVCVVACPEGECRHAEGNLRAEARIEAVQRLLAEIGLESARIELCRAARGDADASTGQAVRRAVRALCALGPRPLVSSVPSSIGCALSSAVEPSH
ncbi:MAG: hydrogenase iron-sulfur subunit [Polyangiaceae bacterium]|nr:hydrogenase iron-sulfur subunit [Polyangiaceae bacterium]